MDRSLKERIIGATVLVVVVVLVVPVFLDGPSSDGDIITERVPLPGQSGVENKTIVLDRDRDTPVPAPTSSAPAADDPAADDEQPIEVATAAREESRPEPDEEDAPTPPPDEKASVEKPPRGSVPATPPQERPEPAVRAASSGTGMWAVQLGSFSNQQNAENLAASLRKQGFAAFLSRLSTDGGALHRVRIGPQKDRESAEAMAERLARAGHKGQVVPHP